MSAGRSQYLLTTGSSLHDLFEDMERLVTASAVRDEFEGLSGPVLRPETRKLPAGFIDVLLHRHAGRDYFVLLTVKLSSKGTQRIRQCTRYTNLHRCQSHHQ